MARNTEVADPQGISQAYFSPGFWQFERHKSIQWLSARLSLGLGVLAVIGATAAIAEAVFGSSHLVSLFEAMALPTAAAIAAATAAAAERVAVHASPFGAALQKPLFAATEGAVLHIPSEEFPSHTARSSKEAAKFAVETAEKAIEADHSRRSVANGSFAGEENDKLAGQRHDAAGAWCHGQQQAFFADAPVGIAVVDPLGRFIHVNRALGDLFETAAESMSGRGLLTLLNPEDRAAVAQRLVDAASGREDRTPIEIRLAPPGERTMVLLLSRFDKSAAIGQSKVEAPVPDAADIPGRAPAAAAIPAGPAESLTLYFIDVTERKHLEAQFAQSQKMQAIGQLAGGVAHDFNNLLTAMIGFCDLLLLRARPGDPAFADIMQIKQNGNRAANLVRQLLAFSRQQSLRPRVLDITEVLAELAHLLRRLIGENIELEFAHGRDLGLVKVDQGQLEQVVINLAVNARDAMAHGGRLTIRTANVDQPGPVRRGTETMPAGDYVLIEVADTGIGIAPDTLARIFEPFFSTKEVGTGTGLGLSTVYGIVKQTGGFVFVESSPGRGATFSIYLPRHQAPDAVAAEPGEPEPGIPRDLTGSGTIMLVEDDDPVRVFGARALRNKGYRVIEAKSGEAALAMIKSGGDSIDLVISDVVMPQMDGPALVRELRMIDCRTKVIFISGYAEDAFRQRLDEERDIHFLPKPFNLKQLALKVKEVLRGDSVALALR
jgi:two-component system, cell cycle sensor histidine kinase and response regulator CckA